MTEETKKRVPRPRGTGSVYLQKGSSVWWIKYYRNGKPYRERTQTQDQGTAKDLLKQRLAEITTGSFVGPRAERIRVEELAEDFMRDYRINGRKSLRDAEARWRLHLEPFFGSLRAVEVSSDLLARYVDSRQQEGAENATIRRYTCKGFSEDLVGCLCSIWHRKGRLQRLFVSGNRQEVFRLRVSGPQVSRIDLP